MLFFIILNAVQKLKAANRAITMTERVLMQIQKMYYHVCVDIKSHYKP